MLGLLWGVLLLACATVWAQDRPGSAEAGPVRAGTRPAVLRYGMLADFGPFQMWPAAGPPGGADLELLQLMAVQLDAVILPVRYESYLALEAALRKGDIQLASSIAHTPERARGLAFSKGYAVIKQALVTRAQDTSAPMTPDLGGRRIAVVRGYVSESTTQRLFPLARRLEVNSLEQGLMSVVSGQADMLLEAEPVVVALIESKRVKGLRIARTLTLPSGELHFAVPAGQAELAERISAALDAVGETRRQSVIERWSPRPITVKRSSDLVFSAQERGQLRDIRPLVVGLVAHQAPFTFLDAEGRPAGLSVDVLRAVLARLGLRVGAWRVAKAPEIAQAMAAGEIDIGIGLVETGELGSQLRFVGPFMEDPVVLLGPAGATTWDLEQMNGRRLALPVQHFSRPLIDSRYPGIKQVACESLAGCLERVRRGEADAALTGLLEVVTQSADGLRGDLQLLGAVGDVRHEHTLAVSRRDPALPPLLKRALDAVVRDELVGLKGRWFAPPSPRQVARAALLKAMPWAAGVLTVLLLLWWWHSRRLHAEVRRTREAQQEAERHSAAAERFVTFLAHEVRNSLHSVIAGAELLRSSRQATSNIVTSLATSARATLGLLNNLLDRDRLEEGRLRLNVKSDHLLPVLRSVVEEMRPAAVAKGLSLQLLPAGHDPPLCIDAMRLQQIVRNLLSNAVKYSQVGEVRVVARCEPASDAPACYDVEIAVSDQGPGLTAQEQAQLFQRYFVGAQGARASEGASGLGLALCRDLAVLMHGELSLHSEPGKGTTVRLRWRARRAEGLDREVDPADPGVAARRDAARPRLLLVEDAEVYAMLLEQALQQQGFNVCTATTVAQAVERLQADGPSIAAVLSDVNLSDGDVFRILDALRARDGGMPSAVAVMSAELDATLVARLREAGVDIMLQKVGDVALLVRQLLQHAAWSHIG
ncbi:transporter substrate-binding domain-containing protein [Aquabacterium sp. A7-Y]|uniref:transporter substrate-binding domain-containing protein n=1 Tax=Aquabacterium sp. A7-Y TaxID=1349605 RepID=UPI00223D3F3D|nr:transporter substrate-binding domain-containing protein [Aquabacterium sp. A7-Y]MCW7540143.1 transporter substrate-binding domain-containing protein [Aquabacterium sp. A7-Y]